MRSAFIGCARRTSVGRSERFLFWQASTASLFARTHSARRAPRWSNPSWVSRRRQIYSDTLTSSPRDGTTSSGRRRPTLTQPRCSSHWLLTAKRLGTVRFETHISVKLLCAEMVGRVADLAVQIHGGVAKRGVAVGRIYRDVRLLRLYEGTSEVQRLIIASVCSEHNAPGPTVQRLSPFRPPINTTALPPTTPASISRCARTMASRPYVRPTGIVARPSATASRNAPSARAALPDQPGSNPSAA